MAHILVVDDDPDIRELVALKLRSSGKQVSTAVSAEDAQEVLAREDGIDLAVVDHMMPGMTGVDLVRLLRSQGSTLRILMLTARSQERDLETGFSAGADDYLTKPFSPRELSARVTALLNRR
ncbi:MAG: response regulator [Brachybacterium sp.]|nr:response regulator [Brachybacterium sp.]